MRRAVLVLGAALVATALAFTPLRSLLPGRADLPGVSMTQPAAAQAVTAAPAAAAALAPALAGPNTARVSLAIRPSEKPIQGYVLGVRLLTPDSKPLNEAQVRYYEIVDFFGQREMLLGESTTDGQGDTSLLYLPARPGPHQIVARSSGRGQVTRGEARMTFDATVAAPAYRSEPPPLAAFSAVLPYGVGVVVLSVWALIAFALFGTARGVLRGARDHAQKEGDIA